MYNIINDFEKWVTSSENIKMNLQVNIQSLEDFSIKKELFLYNESMVKDKLLKSAVSLYLKRIEDYVKEYVTEFTFSSYSNLDDFITKTDEKTIHYFFHWFKDENIFALKEFVEKSNEEQYNLKSLYNVMRYYDYIIKDTLENKNYEATLDFLVDFIDSVMTKVEELSINKKSSINQVSSPRKIPLEKIDEQDLMAQLDEYILNELINKPKSAKKQAFSIRFLHNY